MRSIVTNLVCEFLLVLDKGDDVGPLLIEFARRHAIGAARFHGIGALREATIAYWNAETKQYEEIAVGEQVEVLSMIGNIAPSSEDIKMHAHIVLGKRDGSTIGGHFLRGVVYPTLEVFLTAGEVEVQRQQDAETGLWLLRAEK